MSLWKKILMFLCLMPAFSPSLSFAQSSSKIWQEAKSINGNFKAVSSQPALEIFSAPNVIMVKISHPTEIRIFTILGKLISSQFLEPGIYQYNLDSHGIYIIKTDDISCKVAI